MKNLRALREGQHLSQQKLAKKIGISQQRLHGYETGAYEPNIATLINLANFFETSVDYLVGNTNIKHKIEPVSSASLNANEKVLINKYRKLDQDARDSIIKVLDSLLDSKK